MVHPNRHPQPPTKRLFSSPSDSSFSSTTSSTTAASTSSRNSHVEVEAAEKAFLEGSFAEALTLANRCLKQGQVATTAGDTCDNSTDDDLSFVRPLLTPLVLNCDTQQKVRYASFYWESTELSLSSNSVSAEDDTISSSHRAAAIVLQSWYELYQLDRENKDSTNTDVDISRHYSFLQPFLDAYTSTVPGDCWGRKRPMSLDLMLLFVQWLSSEALQQTTVALDLAIEILRHVRQQRTMSTLPSLSNQDACRSMLRGCLTVLIPRLCASEQKLPSQNSCRIYLQRLLGSASPVLGPTSSHGNCDGCMKDVIQQYLLFGTMDEKNWPGWLQETFRECHIVLKRNLRDLLQVEEEQSLDRHRSQLSQGFSSLEQHPKSLLPTTVESFHSINTSLPLWLKNVVSTAFKNDGADGITSTTTSTRQHQLQTLLQRYTNILSQLVSSDIHGSERSKRRRTALVSMTTMLVACVAYRWWTRRRRRAATALQLQQ